MSSRFRQPDDTSFAGSSTVDLFFYLYGMLAPRGSKQVMMTSEKERLMQEAVDWFIDVRGFDLDQSTSFCTYLTDCGGYTESILTLAFSHRTEQRALAIRVLDMVLVRGNHLLVSQMLRMVRLGSSYLLSLQQSVATTGKFPCVLELIAAGIPHRIVSPRILTSLLCRHKEDNFTRLFDELLQCVSMSHRESTYASLRAHLDTLDEDVRNGPMAQSIHNACSTVPTVVVEKRNLETIPVYLSGFWMYGYLQIAINTVQWFLVFTSFFRVTFPCLWVDSLVQNV